MSKNIDDYIDRGLKGAPELKASERRQYLTQFKERILVALTDGQVMKPKVYKPIEMMMKQNRNSHLYLDGRLNYQYLSKYIRLANANSIPFTMVDDLTSSTNIGLVLSNPTYVGKENIFISNEEFVKNLV
ncbi:MAG: YueI family protein [Bacillaceae bacterium]|nr:YueI family protein [Bacillaceae bacterium]